MKKKAAPKVPVQKMPRRGMSPERTFASPEEFLLDLERSGYVFEANRKLHYFYATLDPAWIVRACDCLRGHGIEVPENWLEAEAWAKRAPYKPRRRRPQKADLPVKIGRLTGVARAIWPDMSKSELQEWLARELFMPQPAHEAWEKLTPEERRKKIKHLRVLLSRYKPGPKKETKPKKHLR